MFCKIKTIRTPNRDFLVEKHMTEVFVKSEKQKKYQSKFIRFRVSIHKKTRFFQGIRGLGLEQWLRESFLSLMIP